MQDAASVHPAASTTAYLATMADRLEGSPGLLPIENLRAVLNIPLHEEKPSTKARLTEVTTAAWDKLVMSIANSFVASLPHRIQDVGANGGIASANSQNLPR
jgi:uncharacterized protein (DUF2267 family)